MNTPGRQQSADERLPTVFVFILICCGLAVILVLADLVFGRGSQTPLLNIATAGACLLIALGVWITSNAIRLLLIVLLAASLAASVLAGVLQAPLLIRSITHGGAEVKTVAMIASAALLLGWLYWRLLKGVRSELALRRFAHCGDDPVLMAKERRKEWISIGAGFFLAGAVFSFFLVPAPSSNRRIQSDGQPPDWREYRFDDFGCRIRLDEKVWKCGPGERDTHGQGRMRSFSFGGYNARSRDGSGFVLLGMTGAPFADNNVAALAHLVKSYEDRSWKIETQSRSLISGRWIPCVVARDPKAGRDPKFRAEWRWDHAGTHFTLVCDSVSRKILDDHDFQRLLSGIELVPATATPASAAGR